MEESTADDIVYAILLRLPVKTLKRFQCVCKSWSSLISSPQFQKSHFRRAQESPPRLLTLRSEEVIFDEIDSGDDVILRFSAHVNNEATLTNVNNFSKSVTEPYGRPFTQSCLGLVCLFKTYTDKLILILNPSTEEIISLPTINRKTVDCVGFGNATSTQEFKVVWFSFMKNKGQCHVFTLGTSHWREARTPPYRVSRGTAPFLHGAVHFLPHINFGSGVQDTDFIAAFDINTEDYRKGIPLPEYYHSLGVCEGRGIVNKFDFIRLMTLGGSLCLSFDFGELKCCLELWILKDYNRAEWAKGYTIDVSAVFPYPSYFFWAYPADNTGDDILLNCSYDMGVKVVLYDPKDGVVKLMKDNEWAATFYMESFFPLGSK